MKLFALSTNNTLNHKGQFEPHEKWVKDVNEISSIPLLFPIISDGDGRISLAFNVLEESDADAVKADDAVGEGLAFRSRTIFVINDQKKLRLIFNYPAAVGLNTAEVLRVVDCLQTAARADIQTPANWVPGGSVVVPLKYDDEAAKKNFPGFKALKPYLRVYPLPKEETSLTLIGGLSEDVAAQFLAVGDEPGLDVPERYQAPKSPGLSLLPSISAQEIDVKSYASVQAAPEYGTASYEELDFELVPTLDSVCRMIKIASSDKSGTMFEGKCNVYWDIMKFYERELDQGARLHNVVTVTGTPTHAEMDSCEKFMKKIWFSSALVDCLDAFMRASTIRDPDKLYDNTHLSIESKEHEGLEYTCFSISGPLLEVGRLVQQLAWLTAAFTLPTRNALTVSTAVLRIADPGLIDIRSKKIDDRSTLMRDSVDPGVNPTCWHHLLRGAVLACGFPISAREEGMGLEIPFDLMVGLADIRTQIDIGEGAALLGGPGIVLYPTKVLRDSIQWHCAKVDDDDYAKHDSGSTTVLANQDFEELSSRRTFLGHYSLAEVYLGTKDLVESKAGRCESSGFNPGPERIELAKEGTFSGGFSIKSIFSLSFGGKYVLTKTLLVSLEGRTTLQELAKKAKSQPVLLYDTETKSAWLVSEISLVLHITLAYLSDPEIQNRRRTGFKRLSGDWPLLPYAKPSPDGGLEAHTVCMNEDNCNIELWWDEKEKKKFGHVIQDFLRDFRSIKDAIIAQSKGWRPWPLPKLGLRGWDYADFLSRNSQVWQKEVPRDGFETSWWKLENVEGTLVILGRGFGSVIWPSRNSNPSGLVNIQPEARLLVASKPCMEILRKSDEHGKYSLGSLEWRSVKQRSCCSNACDKTSCLNIQILRSHRPLKDNTDDPPQILLDSQAVIFGEAAHYHEALTIAAKSNWSKIAVKPHPGEYVRLEQMQLSNDNTSLIGWVAVANLAFEKDVSCRYTFDNWGTYFDVTAQYVSKNQQNQDRFTFNISPPDPANLESKAMYFCIRYKVKEMVFWNNNSGSNFRVDFAKKMLF